MPRKQFRAEILSKSFIFPRLEPVRRLLINWITVSLEIACDIYLIDTSQMYYFSHSVISAYSVVFNIVTTSIFSPLKLYTKSID